MSLKKPIPLLRAVIVMIGIPPEALAPLAPLATSLLGTPGVAMAAQPPRQPAAGELKRALDRLSVVGNVLYVAAHPDDENTRLLAYLVNDRLYRAAYLSVTRGDGGQNLIGPEQGPLLGLIRTQELLAARRVDGAEQFFTRARDFGYSKTAAETLTIWNKDAVLADMVWVIRKFKPDVIITRFPSKGGDTHGHHTASAMLAEEAFRLAGDAGFHPEQVALFGVWQAKRIVWNKGLFNAKPGDDLSAFHKLEIGRYNPYLGLGNGEMAATSRSMHKSQGFGAAASRGPMPEYFQLLAGEPFTQSIFDGVDTSWHRVPGAEKFVELVRRAADQFRMDQPEAILPILLEADAELAALSDAASGSFKTQKQAELHEVIAACTGLHVEVSAAEFSTVPGGELPVAITVLNRSKGALGLREIRFSTGLAIPVNKPLVENEPLALEQKLAIPVETPISNPYWLNETPQKGMYPVSDQKLIGLPEEPPALSAQFVFSSGNYSFRLSRAVFYKWTDPVQGERFRPIEVTPPVMVRPGRPTLLYPEASDRGDDKGSSKTSNNKGRELRITLKAGREGVSGTLRVVAETEGEAKAKGPQDGVATPASIPFKLGAKGSEEELTFLVMRPKPGNKAAGLRSTPDFGTVRVVADVDNTSYSRGWARIEYPHIPIQTLFPEATVSQVAFPLKKGKIHLGYIPGAGDDVAESLRQVGYEVTLLDDASMESKPLRPFDAIITGVRAFNTNPRMAAHHKKLMDYVAAGGTVLVQYNTKNWISKVQSEMGPYPFEISQDRVTDETAKMIPADPKDPLWHTPNEIQPWDFDGWVQERGLYFANKWDAAYRPMLSMNDPGEPPKQGSLLIAKHGKGVFIYTGLAFFRQLPAGVPGAFRLFANLLAYGK